MEQLGSHWTDFDKKKIGMRLFLKICRENSNFIKIRQNWYFAWLRERAWVLRYTYIACLVITYVDSANTGACFRTVLLQNPFHRG
jgi:hypothetical protein